MKRIIEFKNGTKLCVSVEVANIIRDSVCNPNGSIADLQCISENDNTKLIIRLSEIVAVYDNLSIM